MIWAQVKRVTVRFWRQDVLSVLANLQLAIILLLAIALFSISGTVIEQDKPLAFYQNAYPENPALFGLLTWKVIWAVGLDHVYRTGWFLSLLVLFGASLLACSSTRQLPMLRSARRWSYYRHPQRFEKLALSTAVGGKGLDDLLPLLQDRYRIFRDGDSLYASKGIIGRVGPILVHISLILILLGAGVAALAGFTALEYVPSGESFVVDNIQSAGRYSNHRIPRDWHGRVNRFWIDYTPEGEAYQFYSDISLLDEAGAELVRKTIYVNQPLRYQGVTLYQNTWGIDTVRVQVNRSPMIDIPVRPVQDEAGEKFWAAQVPIKPNQSVNLTLLMSDLQGTALVYDQAGESLAVVRRGMQVDVAGVSLKLVDLVGATGLEIKSDPGIPFIYSGFALLMAGVMMSYVSHSQIWALQANGTLLVGGYTNRAQIAFEQELLQLFGNLQANATAVQTDEMEIRAAERKPVEV